MEIEFAWMSIAWYVVFVVVLFGWDGVGRVGVGYSVVCILHVLDSTVIVSM